MQNLFHHIRHADGPVYYSGRPISLADAQVMINEDIATGRIAPGSFLRIEGVELVIEPAPHNVRTA
ncbi:hypothetical protein JHL17_08730 [Azospirillum sp. YIM B02556]|uniref:Uncharacterized protein n=1 Tax=Azospirillum endophyticum TaxID=2800326 RepID=A0ABS1F271_9PROT|nr:hypothetical protein [Azospirillum endophyticum]MBK1837496.1 hypothetical protein [Azospirillum endophyticum]